MASAGLWSNGKRRPLIKWPAPASVWPAPWEEGGEGAEVPLVPRDGRKGAWPGGGRRRGWVGGVVQGPALQEAGELLSVLAALAYRKEK